MSFIQGASAHWWNYQHFQHHSKPNVFTKDPDLNTLEILVLGKIQPVEVNWYSLFYLFVCLFIYPFIDRSFLTLTNSVEILGCTVFIYLFLFFCVILTFRFCYSMELKS